MRIHSVQALRAAAALSVATVHVLNEAIPLDPGGTVARWHAALPWEAGVDLFFVISGFIMVHASQRLFGQPGAAWRFLRHRLLRIVPLYWAMTALFLVAASVGGSVHGAAPGMAQVAASLVFIPWPRPDGVLQPVYSLGWTLNYEMLFYAVFAVFVRLPQRLALAGITATLAALLLAHPSVGDQPQLAFWTDPVIAEFAFGMAVALAAQVVTLGRVRRLALAALAIGALLWLHGAAPDAPAPLRAGLPMALLLAAAVLGPDVSWTPLLLLGDASYALYLAHPFPMRVLGLIWRHWHLSGLPAAIAYCAVSLVASVLAALAIHHWAERRLVLLPRSRTITVRRAAAPADYAPRGEKER